MSTLDQALWISAISLVLLFASMAVIWGIMALMARIPDQKSKVPVAAEGNIPETPAAAIVPQEGIADKAKAAALAVAVALALRKTSARFIPKPSGITSTPWQAAQRADQISRRNQIISHK
ncbi:MAG: hypothetical protein ACYC6H_05030 [Bellilinea sp.]